MEPQSLLRDFAIIIGTAAMALLAVRLLKQPPILGFLGAGLIVSPYTFTQYSVLEVESISRIADLGLVILFFALGIDFGWQRIRSTGPRVIFIAAVELTFMVWIGYNLGRAFGWNSTQAFFLGAAMSISSSAVLSRLLRDFGQLTSRRGQMLIAVSVVEDFGGVLLLSLVTGIAATGVSDMQHVGRLAGELVAFAVIAVVLGTVLVPRILGAIERLGSPETLLLSGLGICFGVALLADALNLSAAAGAFLIGTVVGDTSHSRVIGRMMAPVRDLFGAIFFVSVGMLVNFPGLDIVLVPALVVIAVFIAGKIVVNTIATFLAGEDPRTALEIGTGMPQMGEYSLAMAKVGASYPAAGAVLAPVVTLTTLVSSLLLPFLFRAAAPVADFAQRRSPALLKNYVDGLSRAMASARSALSVRGANNREVGRDVRLMLINMGLIGILVAAGTLVLGFSERLAGKFEVAKLTVDLLISGAVIVLSLPPVFIIVRASSDMGERLAQRLFANIEEERSAQRAAAFGRVIRLSIRVILAVAALLWGLPFVLSLFAISPFVWPVVLFVALTGAWLLFRTARRIHVELEVAFRKTILGE